MEKDEIMKYTKAKKQSPKMWNRLEKFSIRKFSIGAASCLIGAITVLAPSSQIVKANGITTTSASGQTTVYAHGEDVQGLRGTSTSIYNVYQMEVDTSKYTKENPVITVTLTFNKPNQDGQPSVFLGGRPMYWFTVPEAVQELGGANEFTLNNKNGSKEFSNWGSWGTNSRFVQGTNATTWKKNNNTTGERLGKWPRESIDADFNKVLGLNNDRWYDNGTMPTQDIMKDLRAKSQSIYVDWEGRAAGTVTVTYTTRVKDPENTKELTIGMGVYQPSNALQHARVETIKLPVLYKLNEAFEPKVPERTAVTNPTNLTDEEVNAIKDKIWTVNQDNNSNLLTTNNAFKDNLKDGKNSIVIDKATGTATITYKDNTTDTIEGSKLVYKKPEDPKPVTPSEHLQDDTGQGIKYYTNPVEVDINNITKTDKDNALDSFLKANLTSTGYTNYKSENALSNADLKPGVNFKLTGGQKATFILHPENYISIHRQRPTETLGFIPKEDLFKQKAKPTFDLTAARNEASAVIDSLDNLYPGEKDSYKREIETKSTRAEIEAVVKKATDKATENAVELAEMKKVANDKINALGYLTKEEKEEAIKKINSATIKQGDADVDSAATADKTDTDKSREDTKARLNSIVTALESKNLQKAKEKATETINNIPDEDLSPAKKFGYTNQITTATEVGPASKGGTILNIVETAQKEAADALAKRRKEEADKVRQQYKDEIAAIPGLTEDEKTGYNNAIDSAPSVEEMESIVNFAKLAGERKKAISDIDNLQYLNNKQKQSFKDLVENSASKADIEDYVSQATQLNSKMKQLQDLATEARKIKPKDGTPAEKYTSADSTKRQAFDTALGNAESVLDKENGADETSSTVGNLFTALETAINELKPGEKVTIPVDKDVLKAEYDKGNTVKNLPAYTNEKDNTKKQAYDNALVEAKKILDKTDATQDQVNKALETLVEAKAGLNGKEAEFTLGKVDDNAVPISVEPNAGTVVSTEDQKLIKAKITGIPNGATVICKPIVEESGKKYVPVTVTHENVSKDIQIEVVQSEAAKSPLTEPKKVKVNDVNNLSKEEKTAVENAVKDANPSLKTNTNIKVTVDEKGNVTVTYPDKSTNKLEADKTVEAKTEEEKVLEKAKNDAKEKLKEAAEKEIAEINGDDTLSEDEKTTKLGKVQSEKEKAEKAVEGATTPATVTAETNKGVEAIEKVHTDIKKLKDKAKAELEKAAEKEKEDIKADNSLSDSDKKELNDKVDKAKNDAIDNIDAKTTVKDIEGAKQKGEQAIKAVHQSELDKKKAEAKKELETAAEAEKKEIESDLTLDPDTKVQKKKDVDKVKETAEKAVEGATTPDEVTAATKKGKNDIEAVHTVDIGKVKDKAKANLTEAAEAEKKEIDADNGLTESEKVALKPKVDKVKREQEAIIDSKTTAEDIAKATTAGKQAIAGVHTPTDIKDKSKKLNAPQEKVKVKDLNQLTKPEKDAVKAAVKNANPNLSDDDITVDDKGNVTSPKGYLSPKDVIVPALNKPTTPVTVTDPNHLTTDEQKEVQKAVSEANKDSNLTPADVHVEATGNVTTDNNGNLPAGDVVTQALKKPAKPVEVVNPKKLTDPEKEKVKTAIVEANKDANGNPTVTREQVTVDDDGSVTTPIGKLDSGDVVKAKTDTTPTDENTDPAVTLKGEDLVFDLPELSVQNALVAGVVTVEKGQPLTDEDIKKQLVLTEDMVVNSIKKPSTTETGNKEAEVEITLADGSKVTVKVPVVVVESLENANPGNNLAEAKEEAKKHVEEAANAKNDEINKRTDLSDDEKKAATDKVNKAKDDANTQIDNATSSGTAKAIGDAAAENIQNFNPEANNPAEDVKPVDTSKLDELDEEKAKAIAEIEQAAKDQINAINNNKGLTSSQKAEAIKTIEELKAKAIEDVRKGTTVEEVEKIVEKVVGKIKAVNPQPYSGYSYGDDIHSSSDAQANAEALANAKESAKNAIEKAAKDKQDEIKDASLSDKEQAELLAKVEAEKESALKAIETAKTVEDVKEAETIGLQAIASVTVPKKPVAPNATAPQATSAPQATAGTMQDVTYQSPAGKQLPNTGSASSAALASLGLVAATSGFALLGRKARRRK
ncbi:DUF1542 domain-containing protein [Streptococcus sp. SPS1]|nr:DUF1542 domain-containing protein [Streptococcus sp. SPS1]MDN5026672.1 DUF1542 domain-containing protein [Streptococcus sp. SPS1]